MLATTRILLCCSVLLAGPAASAQAVPAAGAAPAEALYRQHCSGCHGAGLEGRPGVPALAGAALAWGRTPEGIAATLRHGIRVAGNPRSRGGVMPSFKANAAELGDDEVRELVEYLLGLRGEAADAPAALRGRKNYSWCVDCHGPQGRGIAAIGASDLLAPRLQYGHTREALFESIARGRAGSCPSWEGHLTDAQIEALARYIAAQPH